MAILNPRALKAESAQRLSDRLSNTRMLVLIYTGASVLLSLLVNGLNLVLEEQIGGTGGLSGLSMRSFLETLQTLLSYASTLFSPFWQAGFLYVIIRTARSQTAGPRDLLFGFKRFPRVLSYTLFQLLIVIAIATVTTYAATYLYLLTPLSDAASEGLTALYDSGALVSAEGVLNVDAIPTELLMQMAVPLLSLFLVVFLPVYVFVSYSFRLSEYLLLEGQETGAMGALIRSAKLMKGHRFQMFKLDLSYWWYYALEMLLAVVCYLDMILPMMGVALPFNETVAYFVTLILYGVLELGLHLWTKCQVDTTYVLAYEAIVHPAQGESETA